MPPTKSCRFCGSEELERSEHKGELTCCRCGAVLEESGIVEGLQFAESSGGGMAMVGRFVPAGGTGRGLGFGGGETREQALQRGLSNIQSVADRLRLSPQHVASAHRLYLMASQRSFSVGRRGVVVAGACLYAICRRERTPHLLIDFCDVLRVSVRSLGQVFMKLLRVLHVQVPQVDPSLFLDRFAAQLNLGDKTRQVAQTAVRLVQAMARDWISTGRRPVGLCGAALLIAARYHDIELDADEVANVVRISCPTISKRLSEFKRTAVARLPASALEETDLLQLPTLSLPPCRLVKRRQQPQQIQYKDDSPLQIRNGEETLAAATTAVAATEAAAAADCTGASSPAALEASSSSAAAAAGEERKPLQLAGGSDALCKEHPSSGDILSVAGWMVEAISSAPADTAAAAAYTDTAGAGGDTCRESGGSVSAAAAAGAAAAAEQHKDGFENSEEDGEETVRVAESDNPLADLLRSVRARADELLAPTEARNPPAAACSSRAEPHVSSGVSAAEGEGGGEAEVPDDSDEGLQEMLLNEQEREAKALIWDDLTRDIMPEVHRRLRQRKQREREVQHNPSKRRRPHARTCAALAAAASAAESVRLSLEKRGKGLAQRIDDEALEALFAARRVVEL